MKYHPGDIITDERGNSAEILEIRDGNYCGRRIGFLNDRNMWQSSVASVDGMTLKVRTRGERLQDARHRLTTFEFPDRDATHIQQHISYLESLA